MRMTDEVGLKEKPEVPVNRMDQVVYQSMADSHKSLVDWSIQETRVFYLTYLSSLLAY